MANRALLIAASTLALPLSVAWWFVAGLATDHSACKGSFSAWLGLGFSFAAIALAIFSLVIGLGKSEGHSAGWVGLAIYGLLLTTTIALYSTCG